MAETAGPGGAKASSKAQSLFQYGNDAAMKGNHDYAIAMYRDALKIDPSNLQYRMALRGTQRRVFGNEPKNVGRMVGVKTGPMRASLQASKARSRWADVLEGAEDVFRINPWDAAAAEIAADAAEQLGFLPLAQWLLESVAAQAGESEHFFLRLAHAYETNQKWDQAIACWEKVRRVNPNNEEAKRKVNSLSANATMTKANYAGQIERATSEYETRNSAQAAAEAEADSLKKNIQTHEQRLESEIEADPTRVGLYLQLADQHKLHNRLDEAEKVLARGRKAVPDDDVLRTAHGDVQILRLRRAIDLWTKKVRENPADGESKAKLQQLHDKLISCELAEYKRRVESRPEDAGLHLHYGRLLATAGKHDEAIAEFQKARSDPEHKAQALFNAGRSFEAKGLPKLAEKNLLEALGLADPGDLSFRNALRYRLGRVCEAQNKIREAEDFYNEVAAEDYTYEDVAQRLQALNARDDS